MLLAMDTATRYASLALHDGHQVRAEHTWESPWRHTVELMPRVVAALAQVETGIEELNGVAVALGPGSFTGLRAGLAVAKGLALARQLPLVGVPTLDILAAAQGRDRRPLCAVLQAGRGRICVAMYRWQKGAWRLRDGPRLTTWDALVAEVKQPTLFSGEIGPEGATALARLRERAMVLRPALRLRRASFLAELAWKRVRRGETDDPAVLVPLYLQYPV